MVQWNSSDTDIQEPRKVSVCCSCGDDICEGDTYYHTEYDGDYCIDCMMENERVAEFNDGEGDNADLEYDGVAFEQNVGELYSEGCTDEM